jgi:hypothetical protein
LTIEFGAGRQIPAIAVKVSVEAYNFMAYLQHGRPLAKDDSCSNPDIAKCAAALTPLRRDVG